MTDIDFFDYITTAPLSELLIPKEAPPKEEKKTSPSTEKPKKEKKEEKKKEKSKDKPKGKTKASPKKKSPVLTFAGKGAKRKMDKCQSAYGTIEIFTILDMINKLFGYDRKERVQWDFLKCADCFKDGKPVKPMGKAKAEPYLKN